MEEQKFLNMFDKIMDIQTIRELEEARRVIKNESKKKTTIAILIVMLPFGISIMLAILGCFIKNSVVCGIIIFIIIILIMLWVWEIYKVCKISNRDIYNEVFQEKIIKPLVSLIYETYDYDSNQGISMESYIKTNPKKFNEYYSSKLLSGIIQEGVPFKTANIRSIKSTSDLDGHHYESVIFSGLFFEIKLSKNFQEDIYIKEKEKTNIEDYKKELGKKEFDNIFNLYTSDINFAKSVLTDDIINKLMEYYSINKQKCELTFKENYIYLAVPSTYMFGSIILYENRNQMYQELYDIYNKINLAFNLANDIVNLIYT